jgi:hypothetical protein
MWQHIVQAEVKSACGGEVQQSHDQVLNAKMKKWRSWSATCAGVPMIGLPLYGDDSAIYRGSALVSAAALASTDHVLRILSGLVVAIV